MEFRKSYGLRLVVLSLGVQALIAAPAADQSEVVAVVDGVKITVAEVESKGAGPIHQARNAIFNAQKTAAEQYVLDYLMERRAKKEGVTVDEMLKRQMDAAAGPAPSEEALRFYYDGLDLQEPFSAVKDKIVDVVKQRRMAKAKTAFIESLKSEAKIAYVLAPPRLKMDLTGVPVRGVANAPVKIVEFADYECPYCRTAQPVLDRLEKEYQGKIAFMYKDFPLPNHAHAQKAAEASHCAGTQGKFWEYHDALFATDQLDVPALKDRARTLKLDTEAFDKCLDSQTQAKHVEGQLEEAKTLALPGTPAFFLNGRFIEGASYDALKQAIEEELQPSGK